MATEDTEEHREAAAGPKGRPPHQRIRPTLSSTFVSLCADDIIAHSIGIYGGEEPQRLHLRLGPRAARWFGERRFHATQQFTSHANGTAELTMEVAINPELERLILS